MKMWNCFNHTCQGESHKAIDKICQDYSYTEKSDEVVLAVVCDGHGGDRYFRSDVGAKLAAQITVDCIHVFVSEVDGKFFEGKQFTQHSVVSKDGDCYKLTDADKSLRQLFSSIISKWNTAIYTHASENGISELEKSSVSQEYVDDFCNGENIEKVYGCTLMAYVQTNSFWFAFQIGDGKIISFHEGEFQLWKEPVPWDEKCFLNKTTSLCDADVLNEFRWCYQGNGDFPIAIFLASDGIDDSLGEPSNIANFYIQILKSIINNGADETYKSLISDLPELSRIGSKDDMSLAIVYDENILSVNFNALVQYQIRVTQEQVESLNTKIQKLNEKKESLEMQKDNAIKKIEIELNYANKDLERANESLKSLENRIQLLSKEINVSVMGDDSETDVEKV